MLQYQHILSKLSRHFISFISSQRVFEKPQQDGASQTGSREWIRNREGRISSRSLTAPQTVWVKVRGHCHCVPSSTNSSLVSGGLTADSTPGSGVTVLPAPRPVCLEPSLGTLSSFPLFCFMFN